MSKDLSLDDILAKAYADQGLTRSDIITHKGYISTGNLALDFVLGGGVARGRTSEFYGLSQSGKSTTAIQTCARAMEMGGHVLYVDFEQALDAAYMLALGVDIRSPRFHPVPAPSLEDGMFAASEAIRTGQVSLAVFDSVPAMTPRKIVEENSESRTTAMERARLLSNELAKLNPICAQTGCAAVFINHERDVIETSPSRPGLPKRTTTLGGSALKFYASQRVQFKSVQQFKGKRTDPLSGADVEEVHSVLVRATVTKNKLTKPMQKAELYLVFGSGFSNAHAAMKVLEAAKVVRKKGSSFYVFPPSIAEPGSMREVDGGYQVQGLGTILDMAVALPDWGDKLVAAAQSHLNLSTESLASKRIEDPATGGSAPEIAPEEDPDEVPVTEVDLVPVRRRTGFPDLSGAIRLIP